MTVPTLVSFNTIDDAKIEADYYEGGSHAVVLGHGKVFDKESWSDLSKDLNSAGLTVIAPNFRGYGNSIGPDAEDGYAKDIGGAVEYARTHGAKSVSLLGGSMGAVAVANAVSDGLATGIENLIVLSPRAAGNPEKISVSNAVFVVSSEEDCTDTVRSMHERCTSPKTLKIFDGNAHAQFLFKGPHRSALISLIKTALNAQHGLV